MSNKPKIYAPCKAGCNWETVHKSDFDASASHIRQNIGEDGICYLEQGKEYKIFAPKNTSGNFDCSLIFTYLANNVEKTFAITHTNEDEYAESFVFRLLAATATTSQLKLVYEIAGVRYSETISGSSLSLATENALYVSGATNVLLYNADATIIAKDGETPFIGENGNWWIGNIDTGVKASGGGSNITVDAELSTESENPVQNKVITEALNGKVKSQTKTYNFVYAGKSKDTTVPYGYQTTNDSMMNGQLAQYISEDGIAHLFTGTPTRNLHCVNKKYVDDNKGTKLYKHTVTFGVLQNGEQFATPHLYYYSASTNNVLDISEYPYLLVNAESVISSPIIGLGYNFKTMNLGITSAIAQYSITLNEIFGIENLTVDEESISHSYVAV